MRDIVERLELQAFVADKIQSGMKPLIMDCLEEITHLRCQYEALHNQAEMNARLLTENAELRERLAEAYEANRRVSDENEKLRRDVKTAVMGDSAELQDVKRENEKLRKAQEQLRMFFIKIGDKGYYVCEAIWREFELLRETKAPYRDGFSDGVQHERQRISYENKKLREALSALAKHCNEMEAQNHDYHTMGEGGAPCISEPLANAYNILRAAAAAIRESGDE